MDDEYGTSRCLVYIAQDESDTTSQCKDNIDAQDEATARPTRIEALNETDYMAKEKAHKKMVKEQIGKAVNQQIENKDQERKKEETEMGNLKETEFDELKTLQKIKLKNPRMIDDVL
ncbi:hypothetical protein NDU88_007915 [Pleurodeles waltl]|uniref:Uncharacterized protein n=1 Tax=Pleurodeles waltl TaxID=8319 RepID=A0AAV7QQA9_PLEWA|nr:hypothetical protein NDU88_007915 [Pleurodeles waltl]